MKILNLSEKIEKLKEGRISKNDVHILGGNINESELQGFLKKWDFSNMPFGIIESLKDITLSKNHNFSNMNPTLIERVRIFGDAGDLDLRRDGAGLRWRFIGKNSIPSDIESENFWSKYSGTQFFVEEKDALLWGKYDGSKKIWYDDRVARAKLAYPIDGNAIKEKEMAKIKYKVLSENGCISFVWFIKIYGGEKNG